jgi:hypothetical protein
MGDADRNVNYQYVALCHPSSMELLKPDWLDWIESMLYAAKGKEHPFFRTGPKFLLKDTEKLHVQGASS